MSFLDELPLLPGLAILPSTNLTGAAYKRESPVEARAESSVDVARVIEVSRLESRAPSGGGVNSRSSHSFREKFHPGKLITNTSSSSFDQTSCAPQETHTVALRVVQ